MLNNRKLILDTLNENYEALKPWADDEFWDFSSFDPVPGIYVFGRKQFSDNVQKIKELVDIPGYTIVFGNSAEGSYTLISQLEVLGVKQLVIENKILLISGGELEPIYPYLLHEHFLTRVLDYDENHEQIKHTPEIFSKTNKPYKFLFLNGRARPHRKYLWEHFNQLGLLDQSLWTVLDSNPTVTRDFSYVVDGKELMATSTPLRWLPSEYEVQTFKNKTIDPAAINGSFIKYELFDNTWGDIYLEAAPYIDTYLSLVTETVVNYPYSFRTEKIAKPLAIGHPWIAATTRGFYRDMHNLGFRTFGNLIDESFDQIDNHQDRMDRIIKVVDDLCQQDLDLFLKECYTVCRYNQQHLSEIVPKLKQEFPARFFEFIKKYE